jgi:hypothetical protein
MVPEVDSAVDKIQECYANGILALRPTVEELTAAGAISCNADRIDGFPPRVRRGNTRDSIVQIKLGENQQLVDGLGAVKIAVKSSIGSSSHDPASFDEKTQTISTGLHCRPRSVGQGKSSRQIVLSASVTSPVTQAAREKVLVGCAKRAIGEGPI